jgi:peptidoglycan/LPS O-acetylase OafA/YrhL
MNRELSPDKNIQDVLNSNRYPSLDGIRAVCIILVVVVHISDAYKFSDATRNILTQTGLLGVQIFFVISGFLITSLLLKEKIKTGNISLRNFYTRRALRILPVALLYLFSMLVINAVFHLQVPTRCFIGAAFFLSNISYFQGSWYTAHYWSLAVEEQYYLLFPFILKKLQNKTQYFLLFFIFLIMFIKETTYLKLHVFPESSFLNTLAFLMLQSDGVLMGSLISILCFNNKIPFSFLKQYNIHLSLILPVLIFVIHTNLVVLHSFNSTISSFLISILLLCVIIGKDALLYNFLNNKFMFILGKLSFSIYIWQQFFTSTDGRFGSIARVPVNLLLITVVSYCSYYFFEVPFLRMKERFKTSVRNLNTKQNY